MRIITLTLTVLAVLMGAYVFWWNKVADTALSQIELWKKARIAEGYIIQHQPIDISGLPYRITLSVKGLMIKSLQKDDKPAFETTIPELWVVAQPWNLTHVIFGIKGTSAHKWQTASDQKSISITPKTALGSATFTVHGALKTLAIDMKETEIRSSSHGLMTAARLQLHSRKTALPKNTKGTDAPNASGAEIPAWELALSADTLTFENTPELPLGKTLAKAAISAVIEGSLSDFKNLTALNAWRDNGGIIDIKDMSLIWGESQISGQGTLTLDEKNYLLGAFTTKIHGFNALLAALNQSQRLDKKSLKTAGFALNLIAKEDAGGNRYLDIPLSLQDGGLFLGPFKLMKTTPLF